MTHIINMVIQESTMERVIDVTTARRQLGTLLDEVFYKGEIITIERKGKPLAQIIPFEEASSHLSSEQKELLEELHSLPTILKTRSLEDIVPNTTARDPTTILRKIRKQKRIQANAEQVI